STGLSEGGDGQSLSLAGISRAPGTIPGTVNPPRAPWQQQQGSDEPVVAAPAQAPAQGTKVASAAPAQSEQSEGFFASLARKVGIGSAGDTTGPAPPSSAKKTADAKPLPKAFKPAETRQAETKPVSRPPLKPSVATDAPATTASAPAAAQPKDHLVA